MRTEPLPHEPPLVVRAQRLFAISSAGPLVIFLVAFVALVLYGRPQSAKIVFFGVGSLVVLAIIEWASYWQTRDTPHSWKVGAVFTGYLNAALFLITMFQGRKYLRFQPDMPTFAVAVAGLTVGVVLVGWVPARRAAHLVLDDLSSDVVNSSLTISFGSRARSVAVLRVTPDSLEFRWRKANGKAEPTYPLADVSVIAVRTEARGGEYPVPGAKDSTIHVEPGEVVVFDLPGGQLVFPARDPERLQTFAENRCRALVGDG